MEFNFDNIKPVVDLECIVADGESKALLEFSDNELMIAIVKYLTGQSFVSYLTPVGKDMLMLKIKDTYDAYQVAERICTTLELHNKTVARKIISPGKLYKDLPTIQSYLLRA